MSKTVDDLKFDMAMAMVDNEVKENLEIFEMYIHILQVSKYARIKLLVVNLAKEIHHLKMSHEQKLKTAEQMNDYIIRTLNDIKDMSHE